MSNTGYLPITNIPIKPDLSGIITISNNLFKPVNTFFLQSDKNINNSVKPKYIYKDSFISLKDSSKLMTSIEKYDRVILTDEPDNTSYLEYEKKTISLLKEFNNKYKNIYLHNERYVDKIIENASKYKGLIKGLYVKIYGSCSDISNNTLIHLYGYTIDKEVLKQTVNTLRTQNIELIIQTNSSCRYNPKISNTYGSQLWLLDFLFQTSLCGVTSVVIDSSDENNIYAYKIFNDTTSGAQLYECLVPSNMLRVSVYINTNEHEQTVIVINKSTNNIQLSVNLDTQYDGSIYTLSTLETDDSSTGIYYGEITYNTGAPIQMRTKNKNTRLSGKNISPVDKTYTFNVARYTVAVMKSPFSVLSGGDMRIPINNEDLGETLVTVQPNTLQEGPDAVPTQMTVKDYNKLMEYY